MNRVKRILAAFAVLVGVVGAFAFKPVQSTNLWGVANDNDPNFYFIAEELNGETLGTHYRCIATPSTTCTISTPVNVVPDAQGRILKTQATVVIGSANFEDLAPGQ